MCRRTGSVLVFRNDPAQIRSRQGFCESFLALRFFQRYGLLRILLCF
jgi:hypothetical protein